ncbi:MAG: hypothetical protein IJ516_00875, partial [Phascolarctobacterium sp.]|nr:hypothetical protein [Phascolarctobacterium sp.]
MASLYTNYCEALETKSRIIQDDINKITQVLEIEDEKELLKVHTYIDGKYQAAILDWGKSCYSFDASYGFDYNYLNKSSLLHNLLLMKSKLEAFKNGWNISELNNKNPNI